MLFVQTVILLITYIFLDHAVVTGVETWQGRNGYSKSDVQYAVGPMVNNKLNKHDGVTPASDTYVTPTSTDSRESKNVRVTSFDTKRDQGIPGAVVSLIVGVFGLLVVGRRNSK